MFGTGLQQIYLISFVKDCGVFLAFGMAVIWTQLISKEIPNHHFISVESFFQGLHLLYTNINNTWMHLCCDAVVIKRYLVLLACLERNTLPFAILNLDLFLQDFPACFIHKNNQDHWIPKCKLVRESISLRMCSIAHSQAMENAVKCVWRWLLIDLSQCGNKTTIQYYFLSLFSHGSLNFFWRTSK